MSIERFPSVFLGQGTPMLGLADDEYTQSVQTFFKSIPRPDAIVVVSSQNLSGDGAIQISASAQPIIVHDFSGFPGELYRLEYPCPGSPELAVRVASLLADAGFRTELNTLGLMSYSVWMPLKVAFPEADIPVVQISMPTSEGPRMVLKLGKALSSLRGERILLLSTGSIVQNLEKLRWHNKGGAPESFAQDFETWFKAQLVTKNVENLVDYEKLAPQARLAHPKPESFYPIFFTLGAAWTGDEAAPIFEGVQYSSVSMFSFALVNPRDFSNLQ